jgi:Na+/H+-dicarboxylate symporter
MEDEEANEAKEAALESGKSLFEALKPGAGAGGVFGILGAIAGIAWWFEGGLSDWDCVVGGYHKTIQSVTAPSLFCSKIVNVPVLGTFDSAAKLGAALGIVFALVTLGISVSILLGNSLYKDYKRSIQRS